MAYRNGNYSAFYVSEPFSESNLRANATKDFLYYNMLKMWKAADSSFPFVDSHQKTYSVRDGSDWKLTLKPRIRARLRNSKNVILFLSSTTRNSRALREEVDYGINELGLPVIVVYPDYDDEDDIVMSWGIRSQIKKLWDNLPKFRDSMPDVPTMHIPNNKTLIRKALGAAGLTVHDPWLPATYTSAHL